MKLFLFAAKVAASLALLWLALRGLPLAAVTEDIFSAAPSLLLVGTLLLVLVSTLIGIRWGGLVRAHGASLTLRDGVAFAFVAQAFNAALPSTIGGDAVRVVLAARAGAALAGVMLGTLLDRVAPLVAVLGLSAATIVTKPYGLILPALWQHAIVALAAAALVGGSLLLVVQRLTRARRIAWQFPPRLRVLDEAIKLEVRPLALLRAVAWSLAIILAVAAALLCFAKAVGTSGFGIGHALAVVGPLALATALPISVAGWGVREVILVELMGIYGVPAGQAAAISILLGISTTVAALPGLPLWLLRRNKDTVTAQSTAPRP